MWAMVADVSRPPALMHVRCASAMACAEGAMSQSRHRDRGQLTSGCVAGVWVWLRSRPSAHGEHLPASAESRSEDAREGVHHERC